MCLCNQILTANDFIPAFLMTQARNVLGNHGQIAASTFSLSFFNLACCLFQDWIWRASGRRRRTFSAEGQCPDLLRSFMRQSKGRSTAVRCHVSTVERFRAQPTSGLSAEMQMCVFPSYAKSVQVCFAVFVCLLCLRRLPLSCQSTI